MSNKEQTVKKLEQALAYTKEELIKSKTFRQYKDLLRALLVDGGTYTIDETKKKIDKFLTKEEA